MPCSVMHRSARGTTTTAMSSSGEVRCSCVHVSHIHCLRHSIDVINYTDPGSGTEEYSEGVDVMSYFSVNAFTGFDDSTKVCSGVHTVSGRDLKARVFIRFYDNPITSSRALGCVSCRASSASIGRCLPGLGRTRSASWRILARPSQASAPAPAATQTPSSPSTSSGSTFQPVSRSVPQTSGISAR